MAEDTKTENTRPDADAHLVKKNAHGADETGAKAPNQKDQVKINNAKREDPSLGDPRWPAGTPMKVLHPEDDQSKAMNKEFHDLKIKAAEEAADRQPTMGAPKDSEREAGAVESGKTSGK